MRKIVLDFEFFLLSAVFAAAHDAHRVYSRGGMGDHRLRRLVDDKPPAWLEGDRVAKLLRMVNEPWMCITHNALFDCCVLSYRYDIHPTVMVDTMSMSRALLAPFLPGRRVALEVVGPYLGVGHKHKIALGNVLGMRLAEIKARNETHYQPLIKYALEDARMCRDIFRQLSSGKFGKFPASEIIVNDMIIRMATRRAFGVDMDKLYAHQATIASAAQKETPRSSPRQEPESTG